MTNIEKIRQEIESRLRDYSEDTQFEIGKRRGYKNILAFIDSLPEDNPLNDPRFGEGFDAGEMFRGYLMRRKNILPRNWRMRQNNFKLIIASYMR